mgnify:CR=1 FL=1
MGKSSEQYSKALHVLLAGMLSVMAWLMIELYGNITGGLKTVSGEVQELEESMHYEIRAAESSRGEADEKLGQYLLEIERRLLTVELKEKSPR